MNTRLDFVRPVPDSSDSVIAWSSQAASTFSVSSVSYFGTPQKAPTKQARCSVSGSQNPSVAGTRARSAAPGGHVNQPGVPVAIAALMFHLVYFVRRKEWARQRASQINERVMATAKMQHCKILAASSWPRSKHPCLHTNSGRQCVLSGAVHKDPPTQTPL